MTEPEISIDYLRTNSQDHEALQAMARAGADRFGYRAELSIDAELAQLLRLRVSQINKCTYCMNLHYEALRKLGTIRAKVDTLSGWRETGLFTDAERAALAYTEALTSMSEAAITEIQTFHDGLTRHFDDTSILEIIGVVINMNIWTRLKLAEGAIPVVAESAQPES